MSVRAKFKCLSVIHREGQRTVQLEAVEAGPANESWSKWTPSGQLTMAITNPAASEQFVPGQSYFLDFKPASASEP